MAKRYDASKLTNVERTPQGFVRIPAALTRTGIFSYQRGDGTVSRELRPEDEVFDPRSLDSASALPVTIGHPTELVSPENVKQLKVGQAITPAIPEDNTYVVTTLQIEDANAISRIDTGELVELSCGYSVDLDSTPGVWHGEKYDAIQRNIRLNHVSMLPRGYGRAGGEVRLRLDSADGVLVSTDEGTQVMDPVKITLADGTEFDVPKAVADAYSQLLSQCQYSQDSVISLQAQIVGLQSQVAALQAENVGENLGAQDGQAQAGAVKADEAKTNEQDPPTNPELVKFDAKEFEIRVDARIHLIEQARKVLGQEFKHSGLSDRQIREAVLSKSSVKCDGKDDAWVEGAFEYAVSDRGTAERTIHSLASVILPTDPKTDPKDKQDSKPTLEQVKAEAAKTKQLMWKLPESATK